MFLRATHRKKNGKAHVYWNIVENRRLDDGRVVQRQVLYLGEISSSQREAWRQAIEVIDEATGKAQSLALFPEASANPDVPPRGGRSWTGCGRGCRHRRCGGSRHPCSGCRR